MIKSLIGIPSFFLFLCLLSCAKQTAPAKGFQRPLPVTVTEVVLRDVPIYVEAIGSITAFNTVQVRPQVGGLIFEVLVKGGDSVKAGDVLYRIDALPYQVALEKAQANLDKDISELEFAKTRLERYRGLVKSEFVSKLNIEDYQRAVKTQEAQIMIDKADVEKAKLDLDYCTVASPIDGKVSLSKVDQGNLIAANDSNALITVLQVTPIYVDFILPQNEFQKYQDILRQENRTFKVLLPYGSAQDFEGTLLAFNNQVDPRTGTIQLRGIVENKKSILWPGEFVLVHLFIKNQSQIPTIPYAAIQVGQKGEYVYILESDQTVKNVQVKTGRRVDDWIVIEEGVELGMKVVTDGQLNLRPGAKVVIPAEMQQDKKGKEEPQEHA